MMTSLGENKKVLLLRRCLNWVLQGKGLPGGEVREVSAGRGEPGEARLGGQQGPWAGEYGKSVILPAR